jgi:hypothetical protein
LALEIELYTFLQILSICPFEKTQISSAFLDVNDSVETPMSSNQLNLVKYLPDSSDLTWFVDLHDAVAP